VDAIDRVDAFVVVLVAGEHELDAVTFEDRNEPAPEPEIGTALRR
jgi:hypothetical protein